MSRRERFSDSLSVDACSMPPVDADRSAAPLRTKPQPCDDGQMVARALPKSSPAYAFNGVKIFSATKFADRDRLGEVITRWLAEHPDVEIVDRTVTQSSDAEFHCLSICLFYLERDRRPR